MYNVLFTVFWFLEKMDKKADKLFFFLIVTLLFTTFSLKNLYN